MKLRLFRCILAGMAAFTTTVGSGQTNSYPGHVIGYVNHIFRSGGSSKPGDTLFGNPLLSANDYLGSLIPSAPNGTLVFLWDPQANTYAQGSVFSAGAWSVDLALPPGQGALLRTSRTFTNTFAGTVLAPDGSLLSLGEALPLPPPFDGPSGVYLLSSKFPAPLSGNTVFEYILGRLPKEGEQFTRLDLLTQTYLTTTFLSGAWNNGDPELQTGEAAFFNVVPEPSTLSLTFVGLFLAAIVAHRQGRKIQSP